MRPSCLEVIMTYQILSLFKTLDSFLSTSLPTLASLLVSFIYQISTWCLPLIMIFVVFIIIMHLLSAVMTKHQLMMLSNFEWIVSLRFLPSNFLRGNIELVQSNCSGIQISTKKSSFPGLISSIDCFHVFWTSFLSFNQTRLVIWFVQQSWLQVIVMVIGNLYSTSYNSDRWLMPW